MRKSRTGIRRTATAVFAHQMAEPGLVKNGDSYDFPRGKGIRTSDMLVSVLILNGLSNHIYRKSVGCLFSKF